MKTAAAILTLVFCALCGVGPAAQAESYPSRPIHLTVGWAPGGGTDQVARIVSAAMGKYLGQSIVIDNRPGAGGTIASDYVKRQAPDGYTLMIELADLYKARKFTYPSAQFDGTRDFKPITRLASGPLLIVANKDLGVSNLRQLIEKAKKSKNPLFFATSGIGGVPHYAGVAFATAAGIKLDPIAFKGGSPAIVSLVSGQTQLAFETPPAVAAMIKSGQLKALSVTTRERSPLFPDIPGIAESDVKGFDLPFWIGLFSPSGIPDAVGEKVFDAAKHALSEKDVQDKLKQEGMVAAPSASLADFQASFKRDGQKTYEFVKQSMAVRM